jgi:N-acetylmuramoyl-L-alanine amidase CwlA
MAYKFKTNIANKSNFGAKRSLSKIKYIAIHFTSNDGDTDENNGKYFANNSVGASAHYFVDDDSVTQSVPDDYVAWSVGGSKYANCKTTGGGKYHGKCTNTNSISIELCDDVKNGVVYPSAQTIANAVELTKAKMKEYGIPAENVIRHFDVTGKSCPAYWCGTAEKDAKWQSEFKNKLGGQTVPSIKKNATAVKTATSNGYDLKAFIKDVQAAVGAKVDGIAGSETISKTVTVSSKINNRHAVVKAIQKRLNALGFNCGVADGIAGAKFTSAVKAFQLANMCVADGEVTARNRTWKKLLGMA